MKRIGKALGPVLLSLSLSVMALSSTAMAQLSIKLTVPDGNTLDVTGHNQPRGDEALILYDTEYGKSTHTNQYGVEVIAVPSNVAMPSGKAYQVTAITSVWDCAKNGGATDVAGATCGNAPIPVNGIVLSATGNKRDVLKNLKAGDTLLVQQEWFQQRQARLNVINPTIANNPQGSGFPGYRASNQIVEYNSNFGRPNTGTNEFGFEVTVRNGIVVAQEGSDSAIPADGFVLSGHGKGRSWLIGNAPIGAKIEISPDGQTLTSSIDFDTYTYQYDQNWAQSPCSGDTTGSLKPNTDKACDVIRSQHDKAVRLFKDGQTNLAASTMQDALENMNRRIWLSYKAFPADTVRGVWHRPVEKTPAAIGQTLDNLKASGINSVFLETFFHGYTIFPSQTYANYGLTPENPKFAGTDLLQAWVQEAHKRNMKVHVWFQAFYGGTNAYLPPGPILAKYPSWANVQYSALVTVKPPQPVNALSAATAKNGATPIKPGATAPKNTAPSVVYSNNGGSKAPIPTATAPLPLPDIKKSPSKPTPSTLELGGYFLDPANPQVQTFLTKLAEEIVTRYDVDGFQLDYIRYPASFPADRFSYRKTTWGYTDVARAAFKAQYGIDPVDIDPKNPDFETLWKAWNDYKVMQVSNFVHKVTDDLRQKRPGIQLSAAVFPDANSALALKHQDWRTWALNGWINFYAPMTLTSAIKVVDRDTRNMLTATQNKIPVYSGIFGPFNDNTAEHVLSQIDTAKQAGASGYVLFDTAHLSARTMEALKTVQVPQIVAAPSPPPVEVLAPAVKPKKRHWWSRK